MTFLRYDSLSSSELPPELDCTTAENERKGPGQLVSDGVTSTPAISSLRSYRIRLAALLVPAVPLGFGTKFYAGPGAHWVHSHAGGIVYEFFWVLLVLALFPRLSEWRAAAGVFAATSLLEVLQLWHPPALEAIRATFLGHALIGSRFGWWDFPHYVVGCAAAVICARQCRAAFDILRR